MRAIVVMRAVAGVLWVVQLVLGILFWTGHALGFMQLHMMLGTLYVLAIWILAFLSARAGAPSGLVAVTVIWGALIVALGVFQMQLVPGPSHWMVRVAHLITVLVAAPLAGRLSLVGLKPKPGAQGAAAGR